MFAWGAAKSGEEKPVKTRPVSPAAEIGRRIFADTSLSVDEYAGAVDFTITLSSTSGATVTVDYVTGDVTATGDGAIVCLHDGLRDGESEARPTLLP